MNIRRVKNAVAESAKRHFRVVLIRGIAQLDPQQANVIHDRRGDGRDDEQDRRHQQQEGADVVDEAGSRHAVDGCLGSAGWW